MLSPSRILLINNTNMYAIMTSIATVLQICKKLSATCCEGKDLHLSLKVLCLTCTGSVSCVGEEGEFRRTPSSLPERVSGTEDMPPSFCRGRSQRRESSVSSSSKSGKSASVDKEATAQFSGFLKCFMFYCSNNKNVH